MEESLQKRPMVFQGHVSVEDTGRRTYLKRRWKNMGVYMQTSMRQNGKCQIDPWDHGMLVDYQYVKEQGRKPKGSDLPKLPLSPVRQQDLSCLGDQKLRWFSSLSLFPQDKTTCYKNEFSSTLLSVLNSVTLSWICCYFYCYFHLTQSHVKHKILFSLPRLAWNYFSYLLEIPHSISTTACM